jgi:hypothetical protein
MLRLTVIFLSSLILPPSLVGDLFLAMGIWGHAYDSCIEVNKTAPVNDLEMYRSILEVRLRAGCSSRDHACSSVV